MNDETVTKAPVIAPPVWLPRGFSFLSGYATPVRKRRILVPFQAIADDSGCRGQGPLIVMAGLIGASEVWADFSDQWNACLKESPVIRDRFKMKEAAGLTGSFWGFSAPARDKKLKALARIMDRDDLGVLHIAVDIAAHDNAFALTHPPQGAKRTFKAQRAEASPYSFAYNNFIWGACAHLWSRGVREQFEFIVDEHPSLGTRMLTWYPVTRVTMREPARSIMPATPIPRKDELFLPLQAADLVAWVQRDVNTPPIGSEFAWINGEFKHLRQSEYCKFMNATWFDELVHTIERARVEGPPRADVLAEIETLWGVRNR
jgi:hypothetical protein